MFNQVNNKETLGEVFFECRKRKTIKSFCARKHYHLSLGGLKYLPNRREAPKS